MLFIQKVRIVALLGCAAGLGVVATLGCSSTDDNTTSGPLAPVCIDLDGDGYGKNCALGPDCNDSDPNLNVDCSAECPDGSGGCNPEACVEGSTATCTITLGEHGGIKRCYDGEKQCVGGVWGECELVDGGESDGGVTDAGN